MPELPEVEVVRRGLEHHLAGATLAHVEVLHPRAARHGLANLDGVQVHHWHRRGKFMWAETTGPTVLVHLGMSGQMLVDAPHTSITSPHTRIKATLADGRVLRFVDQRTFGYWRTGDIDDMLGHIAIDLLDPTLDVEQLARTLKSRPIALKRQLLDQTIVSGIGNIYADEMLWDAQLSGRQRADRVRISRLVELLEAGKAVMLRALEQGGTSFDSLYVNVNGESGYFDRSLRAYGQHGKPCARCGTTMQRVQFAGRSHHFCPCCQRAH